MLEGVQSSQAWLPGCCQIAQALRECSLCPDSIIRVAMKGGYWAPDLAGYWAHHDNLVDLQHGDCRVGGEAECPPLGHVQIHYTLACQICWLSRLDIQASILAPTSMGSLQRRQHIRCIQPCTARPMCQRNQLLCLAQQNQQLYRRTKER